MHSHATRHPTRLRGHSRTGTTGPVAQVKRRALSVRAVSVAIATALAVSGCSGDEELATDTEPDSATTTTQMLAPATTTTQPPAPVTTAAPPPTTEAPTGLAPNTTEDQAERPSITIWTAPRLYDTTLSASWQVTPEEAVCTYDSLNADGNVIDTGTADLGWRHRSDREMSVHYDPSTAETLSTVAITCSHLGSEPAVAEHPVWRVTYQKRHPDSVFPATDKHYFDHDEIRALFPSCRPRGRPNTKAGEPAALIGEIPDRDGNGRIDHNDFADAALDYWDEVYENWDTETHNVDSNEIASGWWTTRQLRLRYPYNSTITGESARRDVSYTARWGTTVFVRADSGYSDEDLTVPWASAPSKPPAGYSGYVYEHLYLRLEDAVGYVSVGDSEDRPHLGEIGQWVTDTGIASRGPNPPGVRPGNLLWDWMDTRYGYVPIHREPTAWAMRTLLEARSFACVARQMREHCESGHFHTSPHMRHPSQGGSRVGSVLWSAVCPEVTP